MTDAQMAAERQDAAVEYLRISATLHDLERRVDAARTADRIAHAWYVSLCPTIPQTDDGDEP